MKFLLDLILIVVLYIVAGSIATFLNISEYILLPWSWFAVMTMKTYRGDFEKITNRKLEVFKLFSLTGVVSAAIWFSEIYWI